MRACDRPFRLLLQMPQLRQLDGMLLSFKAPTIALTLTDLETPGEVHRAKRLGVGALEFRIDRFKNLHEDWVLSKIRSFRRLGLPLIATIRSRKEGGGRSLPDSKRLEIFKKILPLVNVIDLELSSTRLRKALLPLARRRKKRVILSYHNFRSTPSDAALGRLIQKGKKGKADLVKIAVTPKRKEELARFLLFTHRNRDQHLIAVAMGRHGTPSRVLAPLFGSLLTFSFLDRPQAPGQIPLRRLSKELALFLGK